MHALNFVVGLHVHNIMILNILFTVQLVVFIGGPFVGFLMDSKPRGFAFILLSLMQVEIVVKSCILAK